jgi:phenylacetate-CoA ligase
VAIAEQDSKAYRLTMALSLLAAAVTLQGRSAESAALFEQARSANPAFRDTILIELETFAHWVAGEFTSAVATARELAAWVIGGPKRRALGLACGGLAAAETGDLREAESLLGRARQGLDGRDWAYFFLYTRYGEAVLAWHTGRAAECADTLAEVAAALIGMDAAAVSVFVLVDLAESAADAHDGPAAASAARQLQDVARAAGLAPHRGLAAAAAAWAALESGRPDVAVAQATEAVGLLSDAGWRSHLGRAHDVLGRSLAAAGRPGAVAELDRAAAIFTQCGAVWRRDRTIQALRRLGSGGRRAAAATLGPASLTRREREVARLAARGLEAHLSTVETGSYLLGRYTALTSGGSCGQRAVFVYDWDAWAVFWLTCFRTLLRARNSYPDLAARPAVMASVTAAHFSHATAAMARTFSNPRMTAVRLPVTLPTEEIVAGLNSLQPDFMLGYPSVLHALAHEAAAGRLRIAPRRVLAGAEPLLPEIRAATEQAWGVKVINIYGTSEGGGTAVGCDRGSTHISEDQLIVEPVDLAGRSVLPGERAAKLYLTNLYNPVLPLIRYEITDEVTVLPEPCPCGSAHRRIADVQGRLDDVFSYQGRRVHPHLFRTALGREADIVEYQVRQTPAGAAITVRCSAPVSLDGLRDRVVAGLAGAGLERPQVTVEIVDRFERPGGPAKLKRFVPLEAAPAPLTAGR